MARRVLLLNKSDVAHREDADELLGILGEGRAAADRVLVCSLRKGTLR